jgi:hypothetical protein
MGGLCRGSRGSDFCTQKSRRFLHAKNVVALSLGGDFCVRNRAIFCVKKWFG